jgi:dinuclear metal center YbgI/SA1388 family protein
MVQIAALAGYCDELLASSDFPDYAPNGIQVTAEREVTKLVSGVTASRRWLEAALAEGADGLLVHHGYFWKGEDPRIVGMKAERLRLLLRHDVGLLVYHLPLDAHPVYGNNAQLAQRLAIRVESRHEVAGIPGLLTVGSLAAPIGGVALAERIADRLGRAPTHVGDDHPIARVALCTGAGQRFLSRAAELGADAFISGEISEPTAHEARELGIQYFAAGHHATERDGPAALGEHLATEFGLSHRFIDDDNPA